MHFKALLLLMGSNTECAQKATYISQPATVSQLAVCFGGQYSNRPFKALLLLGCITKGVHSNSKGLHSNAVCATNVSVERGGWQTQEVDTCYCLAADIGDECSLCK